MNQTSPDCHPRTRHVVLFFFFCCIVKCMPPRPRPSLKRARAPSDWAPVPLPFRHGLLAPVIGYAFQELRIGISLWLSDHWWHPIHDAPSVLPFEREVAGWDGRTSNNQRLLARTMKDRVTTLGEYRGFQDLFVPVQHADGMQGILVVGPFLSMRPTSASILECWKRMSGAYGSLGDPLFSLRVGNDVHLGARRHRARYVSNALTSYAALLGGSGSSTAWAARAEEARQKIVKLRLPERSWEAARNLVDDRSMRPRFAPLDHGDLALFGLTRAPEHVIVGLTVARHAGGDPVALRVRHFEFQRECVSFARRQGGVLSGRVGDNAVMFIVERSAARSAALRRLVELTTRAAQLARRFGFALHAGIAPESPSDLLPRRFRTGLSAAQEALAHGKTWILGDAKRIGSVSLLRDLRAELGKSATDSPDLLSIRFRRYVEAVLVRSAYRQESVRAELQVGVERLVDPLVAAGLIEPQSLHDLLAELENLPRARSPFPIYCRS